MPFTPTSLIIRLRTVQAKSIFGIDLPSQQFPIWGLVDIVEHIEETRPWTLAIGVWTFGFLLGLKQWKKAYPR